MTDSLRVLSLFAGIGGIDLGLERAGMRVVAHAEIDPYASQVLARHWPDVPNLGDVTGITWENDKPSNTGNWWAVTQSAEQCIGRIDVIAGGFPCQDVSTAGKRAGMKEGTRSGLWSEFSRAISELRPRYVIVENVPGLATLGGTRVVGDLAGAGYVGRVFPLSAAEVGAPHLRKRLFIVAHPASLLGPALQWPESHRDHAGAGDVADSNGIGSAARREARHVVGTPRAGESEGDQRQWDGDAADDRRADVAHANHPGREEQRGGGHR